MSLRAYAYLIIATLFWGVNAVAGKLAVGHVSPLMLNFWRWAFAFALAILLWMPQLKRDRQSLARHWPVLLLFGAVGYTGFNAFLYSAVQYTSATNVAIEQAGIPALIFIANFLLFRMAVSAAQIAGFAMALVGVALTATHGDLPAILSLSLNRGDVLMLFAILAYAAYTVLLRWRPAVHWKSAMTFAAFGAMLAAAPLAGWEIAGGNALWPDATGWTIALWTSIFASLIAQTLFILGVEGIGANRAGLFINLVPVFGTLFSLIIGESLQLFHIGALALTLGGIALAEYGRPR